MLTIHFTAALERFFPSLKTVKIEADSIPEVINKVDLLYPGMKSYLLEDTGAIRKHVNIFIGENLANLEAELNENDEIFIYQALSGG